MLRTGVIAVLLAVAAFPAASGAESGDQDSPRDIKLGEARPFAVLRATGSFGAPMEVLSFYLYWDKPYGAADRKRGFAVRRADSAGPPFPPEPEITWATSWTCPALVPLLIRMESIPAPAIDVPMTGRDHGRPIFVADGTTYSLWARGPRWDGDATNGYDIQFSSNVGTPLADWAKAVQSELADCWRTKAPPA